MKAVWLIIPTYNEKENIASLIKAIFSLQLKNLSICVVDDNSPDGTGQIEDELASKTKNLMVLHRPHKMGVASAYLAGFKLALDKGADVIIQIDADFSHNPVDIPRLIDACDKADIVIGSRYVKGGGQEGWSWSRRQISAWGNVYACLILGIKVKDITAGFVAYNRRVLEDKIMNTSNSKGFNFQSEMKAKAIWRGYSIIEVPIIFRERRAGKSKLSLTILFESLFGIIRLRLKKNELVKK